MGYCMSIFSFVFLIIAIAAETVSFLTSYMYENKTILLTDNHDGLFRRCLPLIGCKWWDMNTFNSDPKYLQGSVILALISSGLLALVVLFSLVSFIPRFRSRRLMIFNGIVLLFNALVLSAIVTVYTTLNDSVTFSGGFKNYSWSYWLLYGAIGADLLTSVFFCCNIPESSY